MYKKLKIILAALWIFVALFLTVVLTRGLNGGFDNFLVFNLKNPDKSILVDSRDSVVTSSTGTSEIASFSEKISFLDVKLIHEGLYIEEWDEDYTEVEILSSLSEDKRPKIYFSGETLQIKAPNRTNLKLNVVNDYVKIRMPKKYLTNMSNIDIETVSGRISISDAISKRTSASSVSGRIEVLDCDISELKCETVSGRISTQDSRFDKISGETVSGRCEIISVINNEFDVSTVSGSIKIDTSVMPKFGGSCGSVSGSVKVYIPKNDGFKLCYETTSGSVTNDFTSTKLKKSGENVYKNGGITFDVETVSGSVLISSN